MTQDQAVATAKELKKQIFGESHTMGTVGIGKDMHGNYEIYVYAKEITDSVKQIKTYHGLIVHVKKIQWPLKAI